MIFNIVPHLGTLSVFLGTWIPIYLIFAMKRMYGQSWGKTILKFFIFNFLFSILVLIAVTVMMFSAAMTL